MTSETDSAAHGGRLLEVRALTKLFPGVVAVDNVDLDIAPGEIVALLGQNGAGKSTLIQVLSGLYPFGSYAGDVNFDGSTLRCHSVAEAEAAGVAFLAQEVNVADDLTVEESLFLNNEPVRFGLVDRPLRRAQAKAALADFGLAIEPTQRLGDLDLASQQLVLIVRALSKKARLLILDEPTAALTDRETQRLFDSMRQLSGRGVAIIFVSHRLAEVFEISDRIVIMRDGRISGAWRTSETTRPAVVDQMVGRNVSRLHQRKHSAGEVAIESRGLTVLDPAGRELVSDLDIAVKKGEIVGLFGLLGSGTLETAMALFGAWRGKTFGKIFISGQEKLIHQPADAVRLGIGLIAQDRRDGLSGEHSIYDNAILADLDNLSSTGGFIDSVAARRKITDLFDRLKIKAADIDVLVGTLSGGNQQKVQVARWLAADARILLLIDPTRGVDVGARSEVTQIWTELADAGCAILLVSSDAEEIAEVCDRAVILRNGRVAGDVARDELNETNLLRLAAGV